MKSIALASTNHQVGYCAENSAVDIGYPCTDDGFISHHIFDQEIVSIFSRLSDRILIKPEFKHSISFRQQGNVDVKNLTCQT